MHVSHSRTNIYECIYPNILYIYRYNIHLAHVQSTWLQHSLCIYICCTHTKNKLYIAYIYTIDRKNHGIDNIYIYIP